jgi:hypothetical protein
MRLKGQLPQQPLLRHYHHDDEHDLDFDDACPYPGKFDRLSLCGQPKLGDVQIGALF